MTKTTPSISFLFIYLFAALVVGGVTFIVSPTNVYAEWCQTGGAYGDDPDCPPDEDEVEGVPVCKPRGTTVSCKYTPKSGSRESRRPTTLVVEKTGGGAEAGYVGSVWPFTSSFTRSGEYENYQTIDCGGDCRETQQIRESDQMTIWLKAEPTSSGAQFVKWSEPEKGYRDMEVCGTNEFCVTSVDSGNTRTVVAQFNPTYKALGVRTTGDGSGTVTGDGYNDDINCSGISTTSPGCRDVDRSTSIYADWNLTATPDEGSEFVKWSRETLDNRSDCGATNTCRVWTSDRILIDAEFTSKDPPEDEDSPTESEPDPEYYDITVTKVGPGASQSRVYSKDGQIGCGTDCAGAWKEDSRVYLRARAADGYEFVKWSGYGGCNGKRTRYCNFTANRDADFTARFTREELPPPKIDEFYADPLWISRGGDTVLYWTTSGTVDSCSLSSPRGTRSNVSSPYNGDIVQNIEQVTEYTLTCENQDNSASSSTKVYVLPVYQEF
ncbi:MAG: hypothetical protein U5L75_03450 [Candidatus Campbellbacteria bacterium]|nr:hypothetical protein [Candidatus Campbellbacteria bacterium]